MLGPVLIHPVRKLIVHVDLHAHGSVTGLGRFLTDNLRTDGSLSRERLHHGLSLELNQCFREQRVINTAGTGPRLGPILYLQAQKLEPVNVSLNPVLTAVNIVLVVA